MTTMEYVTEYPDDFDDMEYEVSTKGWFGQVVVRTPDAVYRPVFYDLARFTQEARDSLASGSGFHAERNLVVVEVVNRVHMNQALEALALRGFVDLRSE